jgi:simple sugar transport system permease protein
MIADLFTLAFLAQVVRITIPYILAALGGCFSERSGVINIALEGKLLVGAFAAAVGAWSSDSALVGALCGAGAGTLVAALYALCVIRFRADQIVSGVAINLMALGLTRYLLKLFFDSTSNSPPTPGLGSNVLSSPFFAVALALIGLSYLLLQHTRYGLRLRAVGDHPQAAESLGVAVQRVRLGAVLLAGGLVGLGGAWLELSSGAFVAEMSGGRGYIALAAVIMGSWRPLPAALACLLFGFADALQVNLQTVDVGLPREFTQVLPYLLTMVVLAGAIGRARPPAALGKSHESA